MAEKGFTGRTVWIGKRQYIDANELARNIRQMGNVINKGAADGSETLIEISFSEALVRNWQRTDEPRPGGT